MKNQYRCIMFLGLAVILFICCCSFGFRVNERQRIMSVRRIEGIMSAEEVEQALEKGKDTLYITGWNRIPEAVIENGDYERKIKTELLEVWGDMAAILPAPLVYGNYVVKEDKTGCIISEDTAYKLFGSKSVVGCRIVFEGKQYIVRGVLKMKIPVMMIQKEREEKFPYLEIYHQDPFYPASKIKSFLGGLNILNYDSFIEGNFYAGAVKIFMVMPMGFLLSSAVFLMWKNKERVLRIPVWVKKAVLIFAALCGCCFLLKLGVQFSEDYLPAKVSDFSFWITKWNEICQEYHRIKGFPTLYPETEIIEGLRNCIITSVSSSLILVFVFLDKSKN